MLCAAKVALFLLPLPIHTSSINDIMTGANGVNGVKAPKPTFPAEAATREYAVSLDKADPLRALRDEFIIPSKANLASKKLAKPGMQDTREMRGYGGTVY